MPSSNSFLTPKKHKKSRCGVSKYARRVQPMNIVIVKEYEDVGVYWQKKIHTSFVFVSYMQMLVCCLVSVS